MCIRDSKKRRRSKTEPEATDPLLKELQNGLQRHLGTKVKIYRRKSGGSIEISFYGDDLSLIHI